MRRSGFTLLEMVISIAILTTVLGILYTLTASLGRAAAAQEAKVTIQDEARTAMLTITRELRQAANSTIDRTAMPASVVAYRVADDMDGNGTAVDVGGDLELTPVRLLTVDFTDLNNDGLTLTQLVLSDRSGVRSVTTGLAPTSITQGDIPLTEGFRVEPWGAGVRVTIRTERHGDPNDEPVVTELSEVILPRN